jgi:uroporphyrinogen-III decarboxylase
MVGCGHHDVVASATTPTAASPTDPDHKLYEQLRAGIYQLGSAQDNLQTATEMSTKLSKSAGGTAAHGFSDLLKKLNAAGQKLGDYTDSLPSFEEFKKNVGPEDDQRLNAIQAGNDALGDIADAQDIVENLLAGAPAEAKPDVQKIQDQLDDSVDAVEAAVQAMGGKVEEDEAVTPGTPDASTGG